MYGFDVSLYMVLRRIVSSTIAGGMLGAALSSQFTVKLAAIAERALRGPQVPIMNKLMHAPTRLFPDGTATEVPKCEKPRHSKDARGPH